MALKVGIVRDERYLEHTTGIIHPEHPNRLKYVYSMLDAEFSGLVENIQPYPVALGDLEAVHTSAYVKRVLHTANREHTHLAQDTPAGPRTYIAAWLAAGACVTGIDVLRAGRCDVCFAMVRPPGHHALPDRAGGFCVFNNLGIAARYAMRRFGYSRILIVDWDLHHGNAIQDLFYDEKKVLYISSHYTNIFPFMGEWEDVGRGEGEGYNVNIVLTKGIEDADLLHVYRELVGRATLRYRPQLILIAAGFDLHFQDIFSRAKITERSFGALMRMILHLRRQVADPPVLLALEGGYRIPALVKSTRETLKALTHDDNASEPLYDGGTTTGEALLAKAAGIHARYGVWTD
jgi:acetoin utilization deacetylase AcuC-like enzyme